MRIQNLLGIAFVLISLFGCETNNELNEKTILGQWKLTEAFISSGGHNTGSLLQMVMS